MAEKTKTKAAKAKDLTEAATTSYGAAQERRRKAEELLIDLEDRAARRAARREARERESNQR